MYVEQESISKTVTSATSSSQVISTFSSKNSAHESETTSLIMSSTPNIINTTLEGIFCSHRQRIMLTCMCTSIIKTIALSSSTTSFISEANTSSTMSFETTGFSLSITASESVSPALSTIVEGKFSSTCIQIIRTQLIMTSNKINMYILYNQ